MTLPFKVEGWPPMMLWGRGLGEPPMSNSELKPGDRLERELQRAPAWERRRVAAVMEQIALREGYLDGLREVRAYLRRTEPSMQPDLI